MCRTTALRILRVIVVSLVGFIAVSVPGFELFVSFVGSFACSSLAFILPAWCHLVLYHGKLSRMLVAMDYFLIAFGLTGMFFGVAMSIHDMVTGKEGPLGCV